VDPEGRRTAAWLERVPSWVFLAILGGLVALAFVLSWIAPAVFWDPPSPPLGVNDARCVGLETGHGFFYDYIWAPILCDEGYNPVNTANLALVLALILLWAYRLMAELNERVNTGMVLAVVPFLVWGSVYRVLEDSDLFAPYGSAQPAALHGTGFLDQYLGIFFITPIIYVEITFVAVGLLLWAHRARRVAEAKGLAKGLEYYAYSLVLLVALYAALWASGPTYIRWVANPLVAVGAAAIAYWIGHRFVTARQRLDPHVLLGAYGLFFLFIGSYYVVKWMVGGVANWQPYAADAATRAYPPVADSAGLVWPVQWWIFLATVLAPGLVAYTVWRKGRVLGGAEPHPGTAARREHGRHVTFLAIVVLLEAVAVFLTIIGMQELFQRQLAGAWTVEPGRYPRTIGLLLAGPIVIWLGTWVTRRVARGAIGVHPLLLHYTLPINLLMVFGQMTDALMTSLGIDLYHYSEKHVLPRFLIDVVDGLGLPAPFGDYPTAMVMIPLKLLIVLLVVVAIDSSAQDELKGRENLVNLVKLGIIMVGLSPGVRDGIRLAMAT